ncbi:MAG: thiosulfate sulfurtransferase GlpE [Halioglobus sp.]|nr:thiosulfate sulfurtransferase GlpE [Halioglobus sp.]
MAEFERISITAARKLIAENPSGVHVLDVRDPQSYQSARIPGASHLSNDNVAAFLAAADPNAAVVVYCYHGNSSQGAAQFLVERGFTRAYSLDGGFEQWRLDGPVESPGER